MLIYKDILTDDELFSDVYPIKLIDDVLYKVEGKHVTETSDVSDAMIGGNKSAEDTGEEDAEGSSVSGVNIVVANHLQSVPGYTSKKDYQLYLKGYIGRIKKKLTEEGMTDRLAIFEKNLPKALKAEVFEGFSKKKFDVYVGGQTDPEIGMQCLLTYREEDDVPYMLFFKDGLIEEKV